MGNDSFYFSLDVPMRREWGNVDLLRTSVQNCFTAVFADIDGCHALAMVTGELLENAVKYGVWTRSTPQKAFRLRVVGEPSCTLVSVENPIRAGSESIEELLETLRWIASFDDVEAAYRARLLEIANNRNVSTSKLGLVRVAYEGNCRLEAQVFGDSLKVTAELTH
jgi:hypothetical protein